MHQLRRFSRYLTFNDVALVPQFNNVASRTEPKLETWLTRKVRVETPLLPANMDTVMGTDLARVHRAAGGVPILHRFTSLDQQLEWVKEHAGACFASMGVTAEKFDDGLALIDAGALGVCIDIAHGHSKMMLELLEKLKRARPDAEVIAGNVCTAMAFQDLANAGADAVKVGIGCGRICTTRMTTGFGVPQFSAILECAEVARRLQVPLIADGGINYQRDVVLALAAGANTVMMGGIFAKSYQSNATKVLMAEGTELGAWPHSNQQLADAIAGGTLQAMDDGRWEGADQVTARYRGQASADFQTSFYGGLKRGTVPEGVAFQVEVPHASEHVYELYEGALRSGLTYGGARSIKELQRKAEFVETTPNFMAESGARPG